MCLICQEVFNKFFSKPLQMSADLYFHEYGSRDGKTATLVTVRGILVPYVYIDDRKGRLNSIFHNLLIVMSIVYTRRFVLFNISLNSNMYYFNIGRMCQHITEYRLYVIYLVLAIACVMKTYPFVYVIFLTFNDRMAEKIINN